MGDNFTVIQGGADSKNTSKALRAIAFHDCWQRQYEIAVKNAIINNADKEMKNFRQEDLMKLAFSAVKYINAIDEVHTVCRQLGMEYNRTLREAQAAFTMMDVTIAVLGYINVCNLITMFPVKKEYDGEKWCCKDYYFTMNVINKMNLDKTLGKEGMLDLLWDYQNDDLRNFLSEYLCATSELYRAQTGKGIVEQWCEDNGIPTYTVEEKAKMMKNNSTGEILKLKPVRSMEIKKK